MRIQRKRLNNITGEKLLYQRSQTGQVSKQTPGTAASDISSVGRRKGKGPLGRLSALRGHQSGTGTQVCVRSRRSIKQSRQSRRATQNRAMPEPHVLLGCPCSSWALVQSSEPSRALSTQSPLYPEPLGRQRGSLAGQLPAGTVLEPLSSAWGFSLET